MKRNKRLLRQLKTRKDKLDAEECTSDSEIIENGKRKYIIDVNMNQINAELTEFSALEIQLLKIGSSIIKMKQISEINDLISSIFEKYKGAHAHADQIMTTIDGFNDMSDNMTMPGITTCEPSDAFFLQEYYKKKLPSAPNAIHHPVLPQSNKEVVYDSFNF